MEEISYLGFKIKQGTISPVTSNIVKITLFATPNTKRQLKGFLGLCGFYRSLIPAYGKHTSSLVKLSSPKVQFKWTQQHEDNFHQLQNFFFPPLFLILPNWKDDFYVNTDASMIAVSGVLLQKINDKL